MNSGINGEARPANQQLPATPDPPRYWFPAKTYGWGWGLPRTWEGWVVLGVYLALLALCIKDPSRKTLRPLIELYGRDRDRMKVEVEILARQLKHRLAMFAKPDDATVRKVITKNEQRVLAVYLHVRSGYRGIDVARFFKVPKTTAYGWLDWFNTLPEGLQTGILAFMDSQAHGMVACQMPTVVPKPANSPEQAPKGSTPARARTA